LQINSRISEVTCSDKYLNLAAYNVISWRHLR